jgi:hypothetical protein
MRHHFSSWREGWNDVFAAMREVKQREMVVHLPYILMAVHSLAAQLQESKVDHIRGHFLHSEALAAMWLAGVLDSPYSLTVHTTTIDYPKSLIVKAVQGAAFMVGNTSEACSFAIQMHQKKSTWLEMD